MLENFDGGMCNCFLTIWYIRFHIANWALFLVAEQLNTRRCVCVCVSSVFVMILLSKRPSSYCLTHFGGSLGAGKGQLRGSSEEEDDLWWKTTFDGRRPSMEGNLRWKKTFDGRWPSIKENLRWKTTFDGRQPLTEDNLWQKTTFNGRRP